MTAAEAALMGIAVTQLAGALSSLEAAMESDCLTTDEVAVIEHLHDFIRPITDRLSAELWRVA